ncbi:hypothetical protein A5320_05490 [Rheinheimera sp. SA_1]|nr:hypothetical protein A5320_05490 [Rheinheimera sp. SA_1]
MSVNQALKLKKVNLLVTKCNNPSDLLLAKGCQLCGDTECENRMIGFTGALLQVVVLLTQIFN